MSDRVSIGSDLLEARIDPFGAELVSLKDAEGREFMSAGDPAFWTGRAPLLFPIVGSLNGDAYRHAGRSYDSQGRYEGQRMDLSLRAKQRVGGARLLPKRSCANW